MNRTSRNALHSLGLAALLGLAACSINPVTGERELNFVSEAQELQIGQQQYLSAQQSQGGEYQTDPELSAYVNQVGQRIAAVSDRDLPYEFVVLNNGVPNAWALPGGKIAVNRGLLVELNNEAELAAVLGHEVVHAAARHGAQSVTRGTLLQGALLAGMVAGTQSEYGNLIVGGAQLGAQLINQSYGREAERESDHYGIRYMLEAGYDPSAAISLQETFVRLSAGNDPGWLEGLFASHPPSRERVENNRRLVAELQPLMQGRDLELGEARYQEAIGFLKETQPAYDLYQEAQRAVAEDDLETAFEKAREASRLVPSEPLFKGLQGDIMVYQRRYREAVEYYDEAIDTDPRYFDYYLGRGVAYSRLGSEAQARNDLERSSELLPTALAANELGKISLDAGDTRSALQYFELAASSGQGPIAQEAAAAFARLDIQQNPQNYVQAQAYVDDGGRILARVVNRGPVALSNVQVEFAVAAGGRVGRQTRVLNTLPANSAVDLDSGLRASPQITQVAANVVGVRLR